MFPLVAIGGVIGALFSISKGASWVADQFDSSSSAVSVGGKGKTDATTDTGATKTSQFESTLAAQVAGQNQPVTGSTSATSTVATMTGPTYDTVARMKAGLIAYSQVGDHLTTNGQAARS